MNPILNLYLSSSYGGSSLTALNLRAPVYIVRAESGEHPDLSHPGTLGKSEAEPDDDSPNASPPFTQSLRLATPVFRSYDI